MDCYECGAKTRVCADCGATLRNLLQEAEDIRIAHGPKEQRGVLIRDVRKNEDVLSKARAARAPKALTLRVLASYARFRQAEEELREALKDFPSESQTEYTTSWWKWLTTPRDGDENNPEDTSNTPSLLSRLCTKLSSPWWTKPISLLGALKRLFRLPIVLLLSFSSLVIMMIFPQETGTALAHTITYMCGNAFTMLKTLAVTLVQLLTHALSHALWMAATRQPLAPPPEGSAHAFYEFAYSQDDIPEEYQLSCWWLAFPAVMYYFYSGAAFTQ